MASSVGATKVVSCTVARAEASWLVQGGISPFGLPSPIRTFAEMSILELPRICINGGRRGLLLELEPQYLIRALPAITPIQCASESLRPTVDESASAATEGEVEGEGDAEELQAVSGVLRVGAVDTSQVVSFNPEASALPGLVQCCYRTARLVHFFTLEKGLLKSVMIREGTRLLEACGKVRAMLRAAGSCAMLCCCVVLTPCRTDSPRSAQSFPLRGGVFVRVCCLCIIQPMVTCIWQ